MIFAFMLALVAIAGGAAATYFYDRRAGLVWRLCAGAVTGLTALGLIGYATAATLGFTSLSVLVAAVVVSIPLFIVWAKPTLRAGVRGDVKRAMGEVRETLLRPSRASVVSALFFAAVAVVWWYVFNGAMAQDASGIHTTFDNNLGDLPFHIAITTGFVYGENFPPQHPEFAGARLTYPFIVDFIMAMFMRAGASLRGALFFENYVLALATVGLLYRWAGQLTRDRAASMLAIALAFLSGGLGWTMFVSEAFTTERGLFEFLQGLPHNYSITANLYRWGNAVTTLFVPQRSMLLGVPLFLIVSTLWWQVMGDKEEETGEQVTPQASDNVKKRRIKKGKRQRATAVHSKSFIAANDASFFQLPEIPAMRQMIAAGAVAGLLALAHAHTFGVVLMTGGCLALIFREWRLWIAFFAAAGIVAAPQLIWVVLGSSTQAGNFIAPEFGWHNENTNVLWFWFINTGLFIPALIAALLGVTQLAETRPSGSVSDMKSTLPDGRVSAFLLQLRNLYLFFRNLVPLTRRALLFYLPFLLCFIVPNALRLSPWVWDNIKVLYYWYLASAPIVALLIVNLWRRRKPYRAAAVVLAVSLMLAGSLDVWRAISGAARTTLFDRDAMAFADLLRRQTPPQARILNAPIHDHPVLLTGRRSLFGYPGHLWTHGLSYTTREADIRRIYAGAADAERLLGQYQIDYVVVSAEERLSLPTVNEAFFAARFPVVGETDGYRLYQITNQRATP